jgi:hypothetical protein
MEFILFWSFSLLFFFESKVFFVRRRRARLERKNSHSLSLVLSVLRREIFVLFLCFFHWLFAFFSISYRKSATNSFPRRR